MFILSFNVASYFQWKKQLFFKFNFSPFSNYARKSPPLLRRISAEKLRLEIFIPTENPITKNPPPQKKDSVGFQRLSQRRRVYVKIIIYVRSSSTSYIKLFPHVLGF